MLKSPGSIAIVIPCYRHARFLGRAIDSVMAQSIVPAEIIVVDDGSPDDVAAVLRSYPQVRLIRQPNRGPSTARNAGLLAARAERIVFLDADDLLLPGALQAGIDSFAANPGAAFVYGAFRTTGRFRSLHHQRPPSSRIDLIRINSIGMIGAVMFDRSKLVEVGGFDEQLRFAEDWDLYLRLSRDFPFAGHGRLVASYTRHLGNTSNAVARMRRGIEQVRQMERSRGLNDQEAVAWAEGEAIIASAYPSLATRLLHFGRALAGFRRRPGPRP